MKVLLLSNLYPTSADGNRGLFTAQLAQEMAKRCELRVTVPLPWAPSGKLAARLLPARYREFATLAPTLHLDGVIAEYPRYPLLPKVSENWHARLMGLGLKNHVKRLHQRFRFDVLNAHWLYPDGVAATRLGKALGLPVVLTGLGCDVNEFLHLPGKREQIRESLAAAAAITVVSQELAGVLIRDGIAPERITTIPNGVDTKQFAPADRASAKRAVGADPTRPLIVCVSRLSPEKGVQVLVEATAALVEIGVRAAVAVIGDGQDRNMLSERIAKLGIADSIQLVGAVPHAKIAWWLAAADVVCMPSLREGHPNAAMEALACGRAIVASEVGALQSLITAECGLLVRPNDPGALADALHRALSQHWDAAKIAARVANASWAAAADRYIGVLRTAVVRHSG